MVIGVALLAPSGRAHFGTPGLVAGIAAGALLGTFLGWWVKRAFLDV